MLKNAICLLLYSSGFIPTHTPCTHSFQLSKECDAFICGSAQTLVYQCIHPVWERDIGAIWKSHLTHTAWDKWEKNLCRSRAPCKELFLKIVVSFGFITLWYTKAQMLACYQKGVGGRDGTWLWHRRRIGYPQLPPLTQICKQAGPSLRRQLCYAHPPTGSSTSAFPWLPGKSWLPSCLPELPPFRGQ